MEAPPMPEMAIVNEENGNGDKPLVEKVTNTETEMEKVDTGDVDNTEQSENKLGGEKELSWEKIAAEIAAEELPDTDITAPEEEKEETVINNATEEEKVASAEEAPPHDQEVIEITELKAGEEISAVDTSTEVEYTVIEAEDVETNEIIEEHLAQTSTTSETVLIINPDQSETEVRIEHVEEEDEEQGEKVAQPEEIYLISNESLIEDEQLVDEPAEVKQTKPKKQRGRKPIADIPLHVLGRDITKPTEGVSNGGRTMPKPRLGVKVPYRNLTSQIVSKAEIEKEIMDRFKLKQEQNAAAAGDVLFARKLTQRLAKKLIPGEKDKTTPPTTTSTTKDQEPTSSAEESTTESAAEIKNNSDLIAILEGDDDLNLNQNQKEKTTEKEIALQQLKELPTTKHRIFKSRQQQQQHAEVEPPLKTPSKEVKSPEKKQQQEVEPRLKTGMVIKTYTRKRKSSEGEPVLPLKKSVVVTSQTAKSEDNSNVYVTKSSRVIKRKVIWDPDETPPRSPIKSPKASEANKSPKGESGQMNKQTTPKSERKIEPEKKMPIVIMKKVTAVMKSPQPIKRPKRLTEVDKLLMDEGAVNMIYDVKNNDDSNQLKKKNKSVISLDKAHKELMSKTNVIKNDLQQHSSKEGQKSLRKKEVISPPKKETTSSPKKEVVPSPITRKKSKDSARSSVHSPPASPPYNAADASRIIRRHSSSSFSSNDEGGDQEQSGERSSRRKSSTSGSGETNKKKASKKQSNETKTSKNNNNTEAKIVNHHSSDTTLDQYKTFTATKRNHLTSIKLNKIDTKFYLTDNVLKELISCLKELGKDEECHVVSITSNSSESFCHGLDYTFVVADDESGRKKKAMELSSLVKDFLRCLLNFPKVLVAGIQGECLGLGVTMLPLFDMVIASDTSTFTTSYAKLGCTPEGGFLLTVPHLNSHGLASELLYTSQVVKADDAFRRGLVTRLCWPEKYHDEFEAMLNLIQNQSKQSIMATKQQLRHHIMVNTESAINSMGKMLVESWTSSECQKNFAK